MVSDKPPLKVMHIASGDLWAGAEVQAYTLLKHLRERCHLLVVLLNPGKLNDELSRLGIETLVLDERKLNSAQILFDLWRLMKQFRPDVVHTHRQKENILGSLANLLSVRAKCLRTSHGAPEFKARGRRRIQVFLDRFTACYLQQAVIAVSSDLSQKLSQTLPAKKVHIVHNGIDVQRLEEKVTPADFRQAEPDRVHIGIIGRLEPVKRIDLFLAMAQLLIESVPEQDFAFHVIGDGKLRAKLEAQAQELGLKARVQFHGYRDDISSCIHSLDIIVMCSDHEGTPMVALEALALKTPVVAHNIGGLTEILAAYPHWLVSDHSAQGYADGVASLIPDLGNLSVALDERYTAAHNADETLALYHKL